MASQALSDFLGTRRWLELFSALKTEGERLKGPATSTFSVITAILLALCPIGITLLDDYRPAGKAPSTLPTVAFGICALLAFVFRSRLALPSLPPALWKKALSLTHTGVAFGCIPAVLVFCFNPNLLADRHDTLMNFVPSGPNHSGVSMNFWEKMMLILSMSAWVAFTEEIIFRGYLVSAIRRWTLVRQQKHRDILAVVISTVIFGIAHFPTWGPYAALALTGLGLGFVIGYIANGEKLFPVVLYHFVFDALSLFIATR